MLAPCGSCGALHHPGDACPACGGRASRGGPSAAALLLGLALVGGCGQSQPLYGAPATDLGTDTGQDTGVEDTGAER